MVVQLTTDDEVNIFNNHVERYKYHFNNPIEKLPKHDINELDNIRKYFDLMDYNGFAPAQYLMGIAYKSFKSLLQLSDSAALKHFLKSAKNGYFPAESYIGLFCEEGLKSEGIKQDYQKAADLYYRAAVKGDSHGQYRLGLLYEQGYGVPKSPTHAYAWISNAIAGGYKVKEGKLEGLKAQEVFDLLRAMEKAGDVWESIDRDAIKELNSQYGVETIIL